MNDTDARPVLRTLFVEDNAELREQIGELLAEEGLVVVGCDSAEAALQRYAAERFDLVVTDVSLPQMSGVDLARAILRAQPNAWVVFLSGYAFGHELASFGPHVRALLKPFELDDLQALIEESRACAASRV
ncbi:MAG: response regulator [Methylotenera sp.]|nr:response regulator [Methylotenera sp.]